MHFHEKFRARRGLTVVVAAIAAASAIGAAGEASGAPAVNLDNAASAARPHAAVVKTARNKKLHRVILVNRKGRSLYSLSAEKNGRFICTDRGCLSLWTPLLVARGARPTGARSLATVKRPDDGKTQVTYRGRPLYTFNDDTRRGDVRGEGFRDVGVWHAAVVRR